MLTKVFPTGEGKGYGPVEYLCSVNPFGKGEREKAPVVLSGNPAFIRKQIDAVPFKHKYTSGVHSFAPEDKPTDEQIMEVIEATEELAFAGLPLSSRSILWVKHEHAGRTELHFLIPRQEANSGKSFNAFPPGWEQKYDPLRDKFNYKYGWARPDDPERARHWQPGINAKILADSKRKGKPNPKAGLFSLTDDLANMAMQGQLSNRSEIVSELRKRGYGINRQGKDYLTIIDKDGKKTRLKGTLFAENFNGPDWREAEIAKLNKPNSEKILVDQNLAAEADARLQEAIKKNAQYNLIRYTVKEDKNEQSTGRETASKSETNSGNLGSGYEGDSGKPAILQKSVNREADESHAQYIEQGLGTSSTSGYGSAQREDVEPALRENPLSDASSSALGRTVGTRSEMAESHRRAVEYIHEWSDKNSQDSVGAGSGDYRWEPGKSGRYDEVDHGQFERTARQGFQSGELLQDFRSLKKSAEKLKDRFAQLNQVDKNLTDFELGLRPDLENLDKIASEAISTLRQANDTRLLGSLLKQNIEFVPIDPSNLLTAGDEAVKWLRAANEQKLLQKLGKSEKSLLLPYLDGLPRHGNLAVQNLVYAHETRILASITHVSFPLKIPDLAILGHEADIASRSLRQTNEFRIFQKLSKTPFAPELPTLASLESACARAGTLLINVNEARFTHKHGRQGTLFCLPELGNFAVEAHILNGRIRSVQEAKIITVVGRREQKRERIIQQCFLHAEWAGTDLQRWKRLFVEYKKYPKRLKILNGLIEDTHSRFLEILAESRKMSEIQDRCENNPFLLREIGILKGEIVRFNIGQAEYEKWKHFREDEDVSREPKAEERSASARESSLGM